MVAFKAAMLIVSGPFEDAFETVVRGAAVSCDFDVELAFADVAIDAGCASHSGMGGRRGDAK
jgi:hypothetical protein